MSGPSVGDIDRADGDGRGCSLSAKEKAWKVPERPILETERRVFCLRCAWSAPPADPRDLIGHLAEHGQSGGQAVRGLDWQLGHRYGPLTGTRRRGRPKVLPPLRMRQGDRRTAEQKASAIAASIATRRRQARERAAARGNAAGG